MEPDYWQHVVPTYIENWPSGLYNLSMPQINLPLGMPKAFLKCFEKFQDGKKLTRLENGYLKILEYKITEAGKIFPDGYFIRLGSRSPKDSFVGMDQGFKCTDGNRALFFLLDSMERIYDDVSLAVAHDYQPQIWLRQWVDIPEWAEFRCFMKKRRLVGASQYNYLYQQRFEEVAANAESIYWAIGRFFELSFLPVIHLDDVVFDVWIKRYEHEVDNQWLVKLLEINPLGPCTDPCLFSWKDGGDFDGELRYVRESAPRIDHGDLLEEDEDDKPAPDVVAPEFDNVESEGW